MALTLDPITVKTELAENYLKKYNNFNEWPAPGKFWLVKKYPDDIKEYDTKTFSYPNETSSIDSYTSRKLVEKIMEHESTFYQLEYLIRKTDKADFQNYLVLMCQHIQCDEDSWNLGHVDQVNILMNEETPLYLLGCVAAAKSSDMTLSIVTTQRMAPISYLFVDLCAQVGLTINLIFITDINYNYSDVIDGCSSNVVAKNTANLGCIGVVTESADIDSALDMFINSSVTAPWKLHRIFVQESVYDEVKGALAAKCSREVVPSCAEAFAAKGKTFVCDALGSVKGDAAHVPMEAYRTAKELIGLLKQQSCIATLSVWAADSQLAHAVALESPARLVWINEYASFHGPPSSSLPVYESLYSTFGYNLNEELLQGLEKRWTKWNKLTKHERLASLMNTLQGLSSAPEGYNSVIDLQNDILNVRDESCVNVDDGKICFCVERQSLLDDFIDLDVVSKKSLAKSIIVTVSGMPIVYGNIVSHPGTKMLLKLLEEAGVPVTYKIDSPPIRTLEKKLLFKKLKVIRSNFGTTFAN